jgi:hypothetical protein
MKLPFTSVLAWFCVFLAACSTTYSPSVSDLNDWVKMHGGDWRVENNAVLIGTNGQGWTTNPEKSGSWLRTKNEYGDFVLELEYSIKGNSGIMFRSALEKNPAFTGYEMQINDDYGRPASKHGTGSLYDVIAPTKNMSKPRGEWNSVRIEARGQNVQVVMNGEKIIDTTVSRATRGYIGIQNHDDKSEIRVRNFRVKNL